MLTSNAQSPSGGRGAVSIGQLAARPEGVGYEEDYLPKDLKGPLVTIEPSYAQVVRRAIAYGLQRWAPRRFVKHMCGKPLVSGVFAVAKPDATPATPRTAS